jgi:transcriptional regulator GlxA family with amidase domain
MLDRLCICQYSRSSLQFKRGVSRTAWQSVHSGPMTENISQPPEGFEIQRPVVPTGSFHVPVATFEKTRKFAFILIPEFTLLAFSSAVDALRIANQLAQKPLYDWTVLSIDGDAVRSSSGVEVGVSGALGLIERHAHVMVCSGNQADEASNPGLLSALRVHVRHGGRVGGICTGAFSLAYAGLLGSAAFTLHWENQPAFVESFPDLTPTAHRFEFEGDLLTCGGGAAATDMMLWVIAQDFGRDFALAVSDMCLRAGGMEPPPEQRASLAKGIGSRNPRLVKIVRAMHENIEDPLPLEDLARNAGYSRRQFERQFKRVLGETPLNYYRNLRLDRARQLIVETDMTVAEVAVACGFSPGSGFASHYKARFGESPSARPTARG